MPGPIFRGAWGIASGGEDTMNFHFPSNLLMIVIPIGKNDYR